jgi:hypothetical protein
MFSSAIVPPLFGGISKIETFAQAIVPFFETPSTYLFFLVMPSGYLLVR